MALLWFMADVNQATESVLHTSDLTDYASSNTLSGSNPRCSEVVETIPAWCLIGWILIGLCLVAIIAWITVYFIRKWYCKQKCSGLEVSNGKCFDELSPTYSHLN